MTGSLAAVAAARQSDCRRGLDLDHDHDLVDLSTVAGSPIGARFIQITGGRADAVHRAMRPPIR